MKEWPAISRPPHNLWTRDMHGTMPLKVEACGIQCGGMPFTQIAHDVQTAIAGLTDTHRRPHASYPGCANHECHDQPGYPRYLPTSRALRKCREPSL